MSEQIWICVNFCLCRYVQPRDSGIYECQVSTEPKMSHFVQLNIVGKFTISAPFCFILNQCQLLIANFMLESRNLLFLCRAKCYDRGQRWSHSRASGQRCRVQMCDQRNAAKTCLCILVRHMYSASCIHLYLSKCSKPLTVLKRFLSLTQLDWWEPFRERSRGEFGI